MRPSKLPLATGTSTRVTSSSAIAWSHRRSAGETPWDLEATRLYGAGVENGVVRQVGVVPKPVQKPHPPLFQPFASSERSIRWCAQEGITAVLPPLHPLLEEQLFDANQRRQDVIKRVDELVAQIDQLDAQLASLEG